MSSERNRGEEEKRAEISVCMRIFWLKTAVFLRLLLIEAHNSPRDGCILVCTSEMRQRCVGLTRAIFYPFG